MVRRMLAVLAVVLLVGVTAEAAPPTISSVTPSTVATGTTGIIVVRGAHLCQGIKVISWVPATGLTSTPRWVSPTQYDVAVTAAADAPTVARSLVVKCGSVSAVQANALTITGSSPPPPPPASGGAFTAEERTSLGRLYQAMEYLLGAFTDYTASVTSEYTDASNHVYVGQGAHDTAIAVDHLNSALSGILGVVTEARGTAVFNALAAASRADQIANAYLHLDRALAHTGQAIGQWQIAQSIKANSVYQDHVGRAILALELARAEMLSFKRGLAYAHFYPAPPTPGGVQTIVGPHGDYDAAMWKLWRSVHYFTRAIRDVAAAVTRGSPTANYGNMGRPYVFLALANRNSVFAQVVYAAVLEADKDRFFFVLDGIRALTDDDNPGTPMLLHFLAFEWQATFLPKLGRDSAWDAAIIDAIVITHDAWKHSDGAAWQTMIFPDCSVLRDPTGCGGR